MKIVIAGSTGYLGQELVKQALSNPKITTVIGLSRRETQPPSQEELYPQSDISKLRSVIVKDLNSDWGKDENVKKELDGVDAAIWTIAITPAKAQTSPWNEVEKVCRDYAVNGQKILTELPRSENSKPLRFVYLSGVSGERDPSKKPWILGQYSLLRGEAESQILSYATANLKRVSAMIAKPGIISNGVKDPMIKKFGTSLLGAIGVVPSVDLKVISKVLLDQVTSECGFDKDTLMNDELRVLGGQK